MVDIHSRLRAAGVPKSCWGVKIAESGRAWINDWAEELHTRIESREAKTGAYVKVLSRNSLPEGVEAVELLTRQAVVKGCPAKLTPFHRLIQVLRQGEFDSRYSAGDHSDRPATAFDVFGKGLIAVPNIPLPDAIDCNMGEYFEVMDFLVSHVYDGGVLVFVGSHNITGTMRGKYPPLFERMAFENCQIFEV